MDGDRHIKEEDKREASKIFVRLKKAHETLIDPNLRAIYDASGVRGINLQGWQLANRSTNQENIRREFEFLNRLQENEIMLQRVHPRSGFIVRSSIAGLFQESSEENFSLLGMNLSQSMDCLLTGSDRVGLAGRVSFDEKGLGNGSMKISYKRALSASAHMENYLSVGPNFVMGSAKYAITCLASPSKWLAWLTGTTLILQPRIRYNTAKDGVDLSLVPIVVFPLNPSNQGAISLNIGNNQLASITVSFVHTELNQPKFIANLTLSPISPTLRLAFHKRQPKDDRHYEADCLLSLAPLSITPSLSYERRLTKYSKFGVQISCSIPACFLQTTFRIKTSLSNYEFRLVFCEQPEEIVPAGLGLALTLVALRASSLLFRHYFPRFVRRFRGEDVDEAGLEVKREQAQKAVNLMREAADRMAREEKEKRGLVIVDAKYGQMVNDVPGAELYPLAGEKLIDVTVPLQAMVNDSQLRIYSGKDSIPGFFDPCPGEPKMLKVVYQFQEKVHVAVVTEDQPLMLPMKAHCIQQD